jgi:hypothetical protein
MKKTQFMMLSTVSIEPSSVEALAQGWRRATTAQPKGARSLYRQDDGSRLLELRSLATLGELENVLGHKEDWTSFAGGRAHLLSDVRRSIIGFVESVRPRASAVPTARGLQVRYIEVPPLVIEEYLSWRERTIFAHVRTRDDIRSFEAYQSVVSTQPGVYFLSEFECEKKDYLERFAAPEYRAIVEQAGRRYICGGEASLSTVEWTFVDGLSAA